MNHLSKEAWVRYVNDELPEATRIMYEDHLYDCEQCMAKYLQAIGESGHLPSDVEDAASFSDDIMNHIKRMPNASETEKSGHKKHPLYKRTVFHYVLAASLTLALMSSGIFQSLINYADEIQKTTVSEESPSITEQIMNRAFEQPNSED